MSLNTDGRLEQPSAEHLRVAAVSPSQLEKTEAFPGLNSTSLTLSTPRVDQVVLLVLSYRKKD